MALFKPEAGIAFFSPYYFFGEAAVAHVQMPLLSQPSLFKRTLLASGQIWNYYFSATAFLSQKKS